MGSSHPVYRSEAAEEEVRRRYLELLAEWPVASERLTLDTGSGRTFVLAFGPADAPPVVALQGTGANTAMWLPAAAILARHLRVYAVDVVGEPGFSDPARPPLKSDAYRGWLDDVFDGLGLRQAALLGVSLGGLLALDYASNAPDRVSRLALLCPGGVGHLKLGTILSAAALRPFGERGRSKTLSTILGPDWPALAACPPTDPERIAAEFLAFVFDRYVPRTEPLPRLTDEALRRLSMPVLAIVGARDALFDSVETKRRLEANAPHAEVRLLPGSGHLMPNQALAVEAFFRA